MRRLFSRNAFHIIYYTSLEYIYHQRNYITFCCMYKILHVRIKNLQILTLPSVQTLKDQSFIFFRKNCLFAISRTNFVLCVWLDKENSLVTIHNDSWRFENSNWNNLLLMPSVCYSWNKPGSVFCDWLISWRRVILSEISRGNSYKFFLTTGLCSFVNTTVHDYVTVVGLEGWKFRAPEDFVGFWRT